MLLALPGSGPAPKPPAPIQSCSSMAEFQAVLDPINTECCDEPTEDCSSGYPATCNQGCARVPSPSSPFWSATADLKSCVLQHGQVLLPVQAACADFLHGAGLKPVKKAIDTAAAQCPVRLSAWSLATSGQLTGCVSAAAAAAVLELRRVHIGALDGKAELPTCWPSASPPTAELCRVR
eukprot:COSAG04_NODE_7601_length_1099_cov_1.453546_2_plen_179_part_00